MVERGHGSRAELLRKFEKGITHSGIFTSFAENKMSTTLEYASLETSK
jgi:hypothetical protein